MRKFILTSLLAVFSISLFAQKIDDIKEDISKSQWEKAKTDIDKFLTNEKNAKKAEGWYYKGVIYNEIAKSDKAQELLGNDDGRMIAFDAFKKYIEMDDKAVLMTLEQNVRLFDIYNGYFDLGAKGFNSKDYGNAYASFKNAKTIEDYIAGKGYEYGNFKFPETDTSLIQNIALSALLAKNNDDAAKYYQILADKKIKGDGFLEIYQFLVDYYAKKGDVANRTKYADLGKELYPENGYWCEVELIDIPDDQKEKKFAKYDELSQGSCGTYTLMYNYSAELFNYAYTQDKKPTNYEEVKNRLEAILKKTISKNSTPEANLLMARHIYNSIYDLEDAQQAVKGTKPDDVKKKADIGKQIDQRFEDLMPYAKAAYDTFDGKASLKPAEAGTFKIATDLMVRYWEHKGDKEKIQAFRDKLKSIE